MASKVILPAVSELMKKYKPNNQKKVNKMSKRNEARESDSFCLFLVHFYLHAIIMLTKK